MFILGATLGLAAVPGYCETLKVAYEGAYPPFQEMDANGRPVGFDIDIVSALCQEMRVTCELLRTKWDDLLPGLAEDKYDMVAASMGKRPEREKLADFTDSYYRSRCVFLGPEGDAAPITPEGLKGKRIATQRDTVYAGYLEKKYKDGSELVLTDEMTGAFDLLAANKADYCLTDTLTGYEFLKTEKGRPFTMLGEPVSLEDIPSPGASFQVKKGNTALKDRINEAIRNIWLDGTYRKINNKYFPFSIY